MVNVPDKTTVSILVGRDCLILGQLFVYGVDGVTPPYLLNVLHRQHG
ncbi:hypothetical protein [Candidatus Nitrospira neomarina]|uniref:Uncharacterized protein n=1 Tax=Candidatus Nitrospira neomarina TaxID=3020899 RepID=A0AA96GJ74_9BACT|nr:hypothetical protein [Candidatus Nitrospira neomarina]WNM62931.1 hypothetical protein PQG83_04030 [Candidatus Nitrospira neomarina]